MNKELKIADLQKVLQSESIDKVPLPQLAELFRQEKGLIDFAPDGECRVDPRDGSMVVFNPKRAKRPHDNRTEGRPSAPENKPCPICQGNTTGVVDMRPLTEGFTFINKNLFPCVFPFESDTGVTVSTPKGGSSVGSTSGQRAAGFHFLQWTSSRHDSDWHNMDPADLGVVLSRLGALEKSLLASKSVLTPDTSGWNDGRDAHGFVSIIKNVGAPVGGSLTHGHQQIVYSNTMPTQTYNNWRFQKENGLSFSQYLQETTPDELILKDLGTAVALVPYFMKRPFFAMLALRDVSKKHLFELDDTERAAIVEGWSTFAKAYADMLPKMGREVAYNVLVHTGPGAGIYLEFLPFTQETGGYEQLGLWVCQGDPASAAPILRPYFTPSP